MQTFAQDGSIEDRALYKPYYNGWEPRLGFAWRPTDRWVVRGRLRHLPVHGGHGLQPPAPLNPPFFFESNVVYDTSTRRGLDRHRLRRARPGHDAHGQRARLRPEPPAAVHPAVERVRGAPADLVDVAQRGLRRPPRHKLVAPVEGNQPLPGVGDPRRGPAQATRRPLIRSSRSSRPSPPRRRRAAATTTPSRRASASARGTASSSWPRTRSARAHQQPRLLRLGRVAAEGAYWMNAYKPEVELRARLRDTRHNFVLCGELRAAVRQGHEVGLGVGRAHRRDPRRLEARRHPPGAHRIPRHYHRHRRAHAAGRPRERAARTASANRCPRTRA